MHMGSPSNLIHLLTYSCHLTSCDYARQQAKWWCGDIGRRDHQYEIALNGKSFYDHDRSPQKVGERSVHYALAEEYEGIVCRDGHLKDCHYASSAPCVPTMGAVGEYVATYCASGYFCETEFSRYTCEYDHGLFGGGGGGGLLSEMIDGAGSIGPQSYQSDLPLHAQILG